MRWGCSRRFVNVHRGHDLIAAGDRLQRKGLGRRRRAGLLRRVRPDARDVETLAAKLPDPLEGTSDVGRRRAAGASGAGASGARASSAGASGAGASGAAPPVPAPPAAPPSPGEVWMG